MIVHPFPLKFPEPEKMATWGVNNTSNRFFVLIITQEAYMKFSMKVLVMLTAGYCEPPALVFQTGLAIRR